VGQRVAAAKWADDATVFLFRLPIRSAHFKLYDHHGNAQCAQANRASPHDAIAI
jgi:hypothetical protein